jgi:hypothetical protein
MVHNTFDHLSLNASLLSSRLHLCWILHQFFIRAVVRTSPKGSVISWAS